ncbi:hypothetical protein D3C81_1700880 [compost metagenome]
MNQGQAYAEAALLGREERLEHHPLLLLGHALASVAEQHDRTLAILHAYLGAQHATRRHGFNGIGKQAVENLRELQRLAGHVLQLGAFVAELHPIACNLLGERQVGVLDGRDQVHRLGLVAGGTQRHQQVAYPA